MLTIHVIVIGDKMPPWVELGFKDYQKRIRGRVALNLIEVQAIRRTKNANIQRIIDDEGQRLRSAIPKGCRVIALDRSGRGLATLAISRYMDSWLQSGTQIALLVGGPEGLSNDLVQSADECWSLSKMTFSHPVVRVVLAEQIYRCFSILEGSPYHR